MMCYTNVLNLFLLSTVCYAGDEQLKFSNEFKFGVATAAYQIEGAWNEGGKGENIWDRYTHKVPSPIKDKSTGDVACDSYHKYKEDVQIMKSLGVNFYRFSISWSRLLPYGYSNYTNPDGVRYYNALIDELLKNNIEPVVTLYHWDLPQVLQDLGGWTNEILALYFEDYANKAFELFGDRVKTWITFNEPNVICPESYGINGKAPDFSYTGTADYLCGRTLLLAHAKAYRLYDNVYRKKQQGKVGITIDSYWGEPATDSQADKDAARRFMEGMLGWWAHPIYSKEGDYPAVMRERVDRFSKIEGFSRSRLPKFTTEEIALIKGTHDFLGLNHYSTWLIADNERPTNDPPSFNKDQGLSKSHDPNWKPTVLNWLWDVPWGFRKLLKWIKDEYDNPEVYVTENGFGDFGELEDVDRVHYYKGYIGALLEAIHLDGCNVKAYTAWSVMDNFEWKEGYTVKFGLYKVDFDNPNRTRTPKQSAVYYSSVIKNRVN